MADVSVPVLPTATPAETDTVVGVKDGIVRRFTVAAIAALAAAGSFIAAGVGAVSRTMQAKARETVSVKDFGATGDGVTDDSAAFLAAIAALKAAAVNDTGTYKGSQRLLVPAGHYYLANTTLDLTHTLAIEGEGSGMTGGVVSKLRWNGGATGIRVQWYITEGDRQIVAAHSAGAGSVLRGLFLDGGYAGTPGDHHAIDLLARASIYDCQAFQWAGNGFNIVATAGGGAGLEGNANCFAVYHSSAYACKNGIYLSGADANAGTIVGGDYSANREWGIRDDSFLGNTYVGVHAATNTLGPYKTTPLAAACAFIGCYSEGDQPAPSFAGTTVVIGGTHGAGMSVDTPYLRGSSDGRPVMADLALRKQNTDDVFLGCPLLEFDSWGDSAGFRFKRQGAPEFGYGRVTGTYNAGLFYNVDTGLEHKFTINEAGVADIDATGLELKPGKVLKVNGAQVVGAQQAAIPNSGDATTNAILAALRAHGLIAT